MIQHVSADVFQVQNQREATCTTWDPCQWLAMPFWTYPLGFTNLGLLFVVFGCWMVHPKLHIQPSLLWSLNLCPIVLWPLIASFPCISPDITLGCLRRSLAVLCSNFLWIEMFHPGGTQEVNNSEVSGSPWNLQNLQCPFLCEVV